MVTQWKRGLKLSVLHVLPPLLSKCHNILKFMPQVLESASIRTSLFSLKKNTSTIIVEESKLANMKQVYSKGLETKRL